MPQTEKSDDKLERALGHKPPFNFQTSPKAQTQKRTPKQAPLKKIRVKLQKITVSFRMNPELWEQLVSYSQRLGLSSCHILEGLATAFVKGTAFILAQEHRKNSKTLCLQLPWICHTTNVQIVREVLHARRYAHEPSEKQVNPLLNFDVPCGETVDELIWEG